MTNKQSEFIKKSAEHSVKKYRRTYDLLEEYDKKAVADPKTMVESGRLRKSIQRLEKASGR